MIERVTEAKKVCLPFVVGLLLGCEQEQPNPPVAHLRDITTETEQTPGFLGITLVDPIAETLVVSGFVPGSPAETSGVRVGDRILRLHRQRNPTFQQLQLIVSELKSGDRVGIRVGREDEELEYEVELTNAAFVQSAMEEQVAQ